MKVGKECVFYSPHWERTAIAFLAFSAALEGLAIGSEGVGRRNGGRYLIQHLHVWL